MDFDAGLRQINVTITVTDSQLASSSTSTFAVTVVDINQAPGFSNHPFAAVRVVENRWEREGVGLCVGLCGGGVDVVCEVWVWW